MQKARLAQSIKRELHRERRKQHTGNASNYIYARLSQQTAEPISKQHRGKRNGQGNPTPMAVLLSVKGHGGIVV